MSDRGRSTTPKPLTPSPRRGNGDVYMSPPPRSINGAGGKRVIVVTGLSKNVQTAHLREIFGEYGRISGLDLPLFKVSGLNRGKAAIEYERPVAAEDAVRCMDGGILDGSVLKVEISAHPLPPPRPPTPPARSPSRRRSISRSPSPRRGSGFRPRSPLRRRSPSPRRRSRSPYGRRRSPSPPARRRSPSPRGDIRLPPPAYGPGAARYGGRGGYGGPGGPGNRYRSRSPPPFRRDNRGGPAPGRRPSPDYVRGGRRRSRSRSPIRRRSYSRSRSRSFSSSRSPVRRRRPASRSLSRSRSRSVSPRRSRSRTPSPDRSVSMKSRSPRSPSPHP